MFSSSQGQWVARRTSQASQVQRPKHLSSKKRQDPRCPDVSPPPALLRNLDFRPPSESPGQILEGLTLPSSPGRKDPAFLSFGLFTPLGPSALSGNSHLFFIYGALSPTPPTPCRKQKLGDSNGKGAYVQIPQEIILSDSFPRTTWRLCLQFPPWL